MYLWAVNDSTAEKLISILNVLIFLIPRERNKISLKSLAKRALQREQNMPTNTTTDDKIKIRESWHDLHREDKRPKAGWRVVVVLLVRISLSDSQLCVKLETLPQRINPWTYTFRTKYEIQWGQTKANNLWQWSRLRPAWLGGSHAEEPWEALVGRKLSQSHQWALSVELVNSIQGCVNRSMISRSRQRFISLYSALIRPHLQHWILPQ